MTEVDAVSLEPIIEKRDKGLESRDPMLLGIIENKLSKYRSQKMVFLISWWVPTADL